MKIGASTLLSSLFLRTVLVTGQDSNSTAIANNDIFTKDGYEFCLPLNSSDWESGGTSFPANLLLDYSCLDRTVTVGSNLEVRLQLPGQEEQTIRRCQYAVFFEVTFTTENDGVSTGLTKNYEEYNRSSGIPYNFTYMAFPEDFLSPGQAFEMKVSIQTYGINLPNDKASVSLDDFFDSAMIGVGTTRRLELQEDGSCVEVTSASSHLLSYVLVIASIGITLLI